MFNNDCPKMIGEDSKIKIYYLDVLITDYFSKIKDNIGSTSNLR